MFKDLLAGLSAYGRAFDMMSKLGLWRFAFIPMVLTLLLMSIIGLAAYGLSDNLGNILIAWWPWDWGNKIVESVGAWLGGLLIVLLGILILKYLILIVVAPFMSLLSERIEAKLTGSIKNHKFTFAKAIKDMVRGLRLALRNLTRELILTLIFVLLGLIPIFTWLSPVLIFIVQSYYAGFGNADYTLERHFNLKQSVSFARQHRGLMIGNGAIFMLLLMTGIGFFVAPVLSTVAATLESLKRLPLENNAVKEDMA
jgi:CysZ protein